MSRSGEQGVRILYHHRIRADDGQAVHVRELIGALRAEGHDVLECALVPKAEPPVAPDVEERAAAGSGRGGIWRRLSLPRLGVEALEIAYGIQGRRMLDRAVRSFRPDVIYERHALHCDAGLAVAQRHGLPLLLEVNSPMVEEMQRLGLLKFRDLARRVERRVLGGADRVLAVSDVLADRLVRECGADAARTVVIRNGADLSRFGDDARAAARRLRAERGLGPSEFVLGFIGYMRPWHRLDLAVRALARPSLASLHLVLVGSGPALDDVLGAAAELGVGDRVHAVGSVAPDVVPAWASAFDAGLIAGINDYASPLKLFDTLAAGVVTIAPRQPNLAELLDDGRDGILFDPNDERGEELASVLEQLVGDRERAARIGAAGRDKLVERQWTWRGNARRVVAELEAVAAARHGGAA